MSLKRKNNNFNDLVVINFVENEILHNKIVFLFQMLENIQIQNGPPAAILNFASHKFPAPSSRGCLPISYNPGPRFILQKTHELLLILVTFACRLRKYKKAS